MNEIIFSNNFNIEYGNIPGTIVVACELILELSGERFGKTLQSGIFNRSDESGQIECPRDRVQFINSQNFSYQIFYGDFQYFVNVLHVQQNVM